MRNNKNNNEDYENGITIFCYFIIALILIASIALASACSSSRKITKTEDYNREVITNDSSITVSLSDASFIHVSTKAENNIESIISSYITNDSSFTHIVVIDYDTIGRKIRESIVEISTGKHSEFNSSETIVSDIDSSDSILSNSHDSISSIITSNSNSKECYSKETKKERKFPIVSFVICFLGLLFVCVLLFCLRYRLMNIFKNR